MLALLVVLGLSPAPIAVEIPVYVAAPISEETLQAALEETRRIFEPGGIVPLFDPSPPSPIESPLAIVVIQPRPAQLVIQGCRRGLHDHRLGHTHLRARRITLWSEQVARAVEGAWSRDSAPALEGPTSARALGRVLAHELGHLFLNLNGHRRRGLMRPAFSQRSLVSSGRRRFHIAHEDLDAMREALAGIAGIR